MQNAAQKINPEILSMRTLYLIRHAEAESLTNSDFNRCLTSYGEEEAVWTGDLLKQNQDIDVVISSPAQRALSTTNIIIKQLALEVKPVFLPQIYEADLATLLEVVSLIADTYQHPLLIAHNPGITELASYLSNEDISNLPTCGICMLEFNIESWRDIYQGVAQVKLCSYPHI